MSRYWTVWAAALLFFAAFYALLVPVPLYMEAAGLPDWQIGLILGAFGIASLVGRPLTGAVSDSLGRRPVILFGTVSLAAGAALMSFTSSPVLLFGLRVLQAAGYVTFTTAATALVADLADPNRRGAALALFGAAANVAITLTPAAVSAGLEQLALQFGCPVSTCPTWCFQAGDGSAAVEGGGLCPIWGRGIGHSAFFLSSALSLLAGGLVWRVIPGVSGRVSGGFSFAELVSLPQPLRGPMLTTALFGVSFGALFAFLPLLAERRELASTGAAYAVYGVSIIATRILTGRLLDRPNRARVLLPALVTNAAGLAGLAVAADMPILAGSAALMGIGSGICHPALIAICVDRMPSAQRGRATAGFYLAFDLGIGLGSWLLGLILDAVGLSGLYFAAAFVSAVAAVSAPVLSGSQRALRQRAD
ncbi:MAG: MFS transporter [Caldilineaceae bacterium]|nr:MFS transporter [Caldilineaceae bacterium]MDE0339715.1 MFS transporter [Caldilineaceae bacterium]